MEPADYKPFPPEAHQYVDGCMTAEGEREFERRIAGNEQLRQQVQSLQGALDLLRGLPFNDPGESFDKRVIGRVREEELADRARRQITPAPTPLWQYVVQVGVGAVAAALVFALVGFPGLFGGDDEVTTDDRVTPLSTRPTEEDLLPALADHKARFDSLARSVKTTSVDDPRLQRRLIVLELEHSDLVRRSRWLNTQVAGLPVSAREPYREFLDSLSGALATINDELSNSRSENRAVDIAMIRRALNEVDAPEGQISQIQLVRRSGELVDSGPEMRIATPRAPDEIGLYSLIRRADYRHDHGAVLDAADIYLRHFDRGQFRDQAHASAVAALLRLGEGARAAERFINAFGEYDEDITPEQRRVLQGMLTDDEYRYLLKLRNQARGG